MYLSFTVNGSIILLQLLFKIFHLRMQSYWLPLSNLGIDECFVSRVPCAASHKSMCICYQQIFLSDFIHFFRQGMSQFSITWGSTTSKPKLYKIKSPGVSIELQNRCQNCFCCTVEVFFFKLPMDHHRNYNFFR